MVGCFHLMKEYDSQAEKMGSQWFIQIKMEVLKNLVKQIKRFILNHFSETQNEQSKMTGKQKGNVTGLIWKLVEPHFFKENLNNPEPQETLNEEVKSEKSDDLKEEDEGAD